MVHELKILPEYFEAVSDGRKKFEFRYNDRDFRVGDLLILREYENGHYTGRLIEKTITYILNTCHGMLLNYCVLSFD